MCVTKRQVIALASVYALVRGVIDAFRPSDENSAENAAYDRTAFDATMTAVDNVAEPTKGE